MTPSRDFHRAYAQLTVRERVIAEWEVYKAERGPDLALRTTMPAEQWETFDRLIGWLDRLDAIGRDWTLALARRVAELEALSGWYASLRIVGLRLEPL